VLAIVELRSGAGGLLVDEMKGRKVAEMWSGEVSGELRKCARMDGCDRGGWIKARWLSAGISYSWFVRRGSYFTTVILLWTPTSNTNSWRLMFRDCRAPVTEGTHLSWRELRTEALVGLSRASFVTLGLVSCSLFFPFSLLCWHLSHDTPTTFSPHTRDSISPHIRPQNLTTVLSSAAASHTTRPKQRCPPPLQNRATSLKSLIRSKYLSAFAPTGKPTSGPILPSLTSIPTSWDTIGWHMSQRKYALPQREQRDQRVNVRLPDMPV